MSRERGGSDFRKVPLRGEYLRKMVLHEQESKKFRRLV